MNSAQRKKFLQALKDPESKALLAQIFHEQLAPQEQATEEKSGGALQPMKNQSVLAKYLKWFPATVVWAAAILGIVTGYLALFPRILVYSTEPLNPTNPMITPFVTTNDGPLGINKVSFECDIRNITVSTAKSPTVSDTLVSWNADTPRIEVGERSTGQCYWPFRFEVPLKSGDIEVWISYRPDFWPFRQNRKFRFITWTDNQGRLVWLPKPVNEPDFIQQK